MTISARHAQVRTEYLFAWHWANGKTTRPPDLTFAHGWWTIRFWPLGYGTKHRTRDIKAMTGVLRMRAKAKAEAE